MHGQSLQRLGERISGANHPRKRGKSERVNKETRQLRKTIKAKRTARTTLCRLSTELLAIIGTLVSLCGFVVQFVGLRAMHCSATIAQLCATLVMTILRAWVRRGLAERPAFQRLPSDFEVDWLATRIGNLAAVQWPSSNSHKGGGPLWDQGCCDWDTMSCHVASLLSVTNCVSPIEG